MTDSLAQSLVEAAAGAHDQADAEWLAGVSTGPIRKVRARGMTVAVLEALCKRARLPRHRPRTCRATVQGADMTDVPKIRALQGRMAYVVNQLRLIHADLLDLPSDVDADAIPVIRRAVTDAKHHASAGFYALGALADSVAHQEAQR